MYNETGLVNLFEAVMDLAYEDAKFFPTVKFKPNNAEHNKKQMQKLARATKIRIEAQTYIDTLKERFGN